METPTKPIIVYHGDGDCLEITPEEASFFHLKHEDKIYDDALEALRKRRNADG
jgi:hypothetical protein